MLETLRRMREKRGSDDRGFTLIELLVVVVIIGVLVAIAVPVYLNYRKGAENKAAQSDVRNAVTVVEQCYTDNANKYPATVPEGTPGTSLTLTGCGSNMNASPGVKLKYTLLADGSYEISGQHENSPTKYTYKSLTGKTTSAP